MSLSTYASVDRLGWGESWGRSASGGQREDHECSVLGQHCQIGVGQGCCNEGAAYVNGEMLELHRALQQPHTPAGNLERRQKEG